MERIPDHSATHPKQEQGSTVQPDPRSPESENKPQSGNKPHAPTPVGTFSKKALFYLGIGAIATTLSARYLSGNDDPAKGRSVETSADVAARDKLIKSYGGNPSNLSSVKTDPSFNFNARALQFGLLAAFGALGLSGMGRIKKGVGLVAQKQVNGFRDLIDHQVHDMDGLSGALYGFTAAESKYNREMVNFSARMPIADLRNQAAIARDQGNHHLAAEKLAEIDETALQGWEKSLPRRWFPSLRGDRTLTSPSYTQTTTKAETPVDKNGKPLGPTTYTQEAETSQEPSKLSKAKHGETNGERFTPPKKIPGRFYGL